MLLLDQVYLEASLKLLQVQNIDAEHVGDIKLSTAKDAEIIEHAKKNKQTIIALDSDFHTLLALSASSTRSFCYKNPY